LFEVISGTLVTLVLLYCTAMVAAPLARRALPSGGVSLQVLAAVVVGGVVLTLAFHLLLAVSMFTRTAAVALMAGVAIGSRAAGLRHSELVCLIRDCTVALRSVVAKLRWHPFDAVYGLALVFALISAARALMLPTVGWDSITYHYVKAGMWVQSGGPITLEAPGGWSMYRSIFGGGEIFTAWAMLPFGNDLWAGVVDVFWWACLGLSLWVLGRQLGLDARSRIACVLYAMFIPAAWDEVGWGYVDLTNTALLLMGMVFTIHYSRVRDGAVLFVALLALGLAAGVKLTSVPYLVFTAAVVIADHFWTRAESRGLSTPKLFSVLSFGAVATLLITSPWMLSNFFETGYPLRFPMTIGSLQLGADNPAFAWSQERELAAYTFAAEWQALAKLFQLPTVNESHLSVWSLLPLALAPIGFVRLGVTRPQLRPGLALIAGLCLAVLMAFYNGAFSFSRLEFTWVNGRFLMPILFVALPLAVSAAPQRHRFRTWLVSYLLLGVLIHILCAGFYRVTMPSVWLIAGGALAAVALLLVLAVLAYREHSQGANASVLALALLLVVSGLTTLRDTDDRYLMLGNRNVSADVFRYWWQSTHRAEVQGQRLRIAVTSGPRQDADNWLMYYFLGRDLQNTLHYVPISADGEIIPFGPDGAREAGASVEKWLSRLEEEKISHVFSFHPTSLEIGWMDARPERFVRIDGLEDHWGFFRVENSASKASP
jgi:hypothetical protein